jgi:hypothetical protein
LSRDGTLGHFRVSSIGEALPDAAVVEIGTQQKLSGRFEQTTKGRATSGLSFLGDDGASYPVVNHPDGASVGCGSVTVSAYPVRPSPPLPASPVDMWIAELIETYVGEWRDGKRDGYGTCTRRGGTKYVGEWHDGKEHGEGTVSGLHGVQYMGEWRDGKPHGHGTRIRHDGSKYVGEWRDGKEHGPGTETRRDGEQYVGEWSSGLMKGLGTLTKPDGEQYVGEWRDCARQGQGILVRADGTRQEGIWDKGTFVRSMPVALPHWLLDQLRGGPSKPPGS